MLLTHLSLQRVGYRKTPRVLSNEERMRAFRAIAPVQFANTIFHSASRPDKDGWTPEGIVDPHPTQWREERDALFAALDRAGASSRADHHFFADKGTTP